MTSFLNGPGSDPRHDLDETIRLFAELGFALHRLAGKLDDEDSALAALLTAQLARVMVLVDEGFDRFQSLAKLILATLDAESGDDP